MEQWLDTRTRVLREGVSKRQILRETGMHWTTLEKILTQSSPPGYRRSQRPKRPKIDPYVDRIRAILEQDQHIHRKQRHTAKRIWERLQEEGFTGGYTIVTYLEARQERTILKLEKAIRRCDLVIVDELGYLPLGRMGGRAPVRLLPPVLRTNQPDRDDASALCGLAPGVDQR